MGKYELLAPSRQSSSREDGEQLQRPEGGSPDPQISPGADLSTSAYEREERRPGIDQARLSLRLRPHGLHACRVPGSHSVGKTEGQDAHSPSCAF